MKIKSILSIFLLIFFLTSMPSFAFLRKDMYERSNRILQLSHNQGDYSSYSQMMEMYQNMRGMVKSDLELGNPDTAVDYELLTEGLILENYQALQSLLGFNNYHDTTKEFSEEIDHTYAQKLAYALKQNKISFQTHFDVKKAAEQAKCKVAINGKELKQLSFIGPAGIPFYIGLYCADNMFEVKKIQAAESQKFYTISFSNLRTAIYNDDPVEMGVPNPYPASKFESKQKLNANQKSGQKLNQKPDEKLNQKQAQTQNQNSKTTPATRYTLSDEKPGLFGVKGLRLATGAGVDWYIGYDQHYYYRFAPAKIAILLYSSTQLVYKNFEFILDIGPAVKSSKVVSAKESYLIEDHTTFFRPTFAFTEDIYQFRDIFTLNFDLGGTVFFVGTTNSFKPISYGLRAAVEPRVYLGSSFFVEGLFTATYNFIGPAQNSLLGASLLIGADL